MREVWRQRLPYYAYGDITLLLDTIQEGTTKQQRRERDLIGEKEAKLLFRVTNFFNPSHILQIGAASGVESVAMLAVNSNSRLHLYDMQLDQNPLAVRVLQSRQGRVECYDDLGIALGEALGDDGASTLALVNVPVDEAVLKRLLDNHCVVVLRNVNRDKTMRDLFGTCCDSMPIGQTYTNGKIAILNPNPKLQREDFLLWL